jgi:hypothetical protein
LLNWMPACAGMTANAIRMHDFGLIEARHTITHGDDPTAHAIVTNSSAEVGWIATVWRKSA